MLTYMSNVYKSELLQVAEMNGAKVDALRDLISKHK